MSSLPPPGATPPDATDRRIALGVFAAAILWQLPFFDRWLALLDEGYILAIATDINRGQVLYRDVYIDGPMPLAFETLAAWFRITGASVLSSRWLAVLGFAVYASAMYRVSREVLTRAAALAFVLFLFCYRVWAFPHWQVYSYSLLAATLLLVAAALLLRAVETNSARWRIAAGMVLGLGVLAKQDYGGMVSVAFGFLMLALPWLERRERPHLLSPLVPAFQLTCGALLVVLPVLSAYVFAGAGEAMLQQTLLFPLSVIDDQRYTLLPDLRPLLAQDAALRAQIGSYFPSLPATLWWKECEGCFAAHLGAGRIYNETALVDTAIKLLYWSPLGLGLFAAIVQLGRIATGMRTPISREVRSALAVLALGLGFLAAFNKPRDWVHLMMIYPPVLLAGLGAVGVLLRAMPRPFLAATRTAAGIGLAGLLAVTLAMIVDMRRVFDHPLPFARGGVWADRQNGPLIDAIVQWQDQNVDKDVPLPSWPTQPMLVFLSERETVGTYHVIWPGQNPARDTTLREEMVRRGVNRLLFSISQWGHLGSFESIAPEFHADMVRDWEIEHVFSLEPVGPIVAALQRSQPAVPHTALSEFIKDEFVLVDWPFAPVLSQPVEAPSAAVGRTVELRVPADRPLLEMAAGINPNRWFGAPSAPFEFRVELVDAAGQHPLAHLRIQPREAVGDRRWHPLALDLSPWADQDIRLRFTITADDLRENPENLAGWREPAFRALREERRTAKPQERSASAKPGVPPDS